MKNKEELNEIKKEVKTLNQKLAELNEEELKQVTGGLIPPYPPLSVAKKPGFDGNAGAGNNAVNPRISVADETDMLIIKTDP